MPGNSPDVIPLRNGFSIIQWLARLFLFAAAILTPLSAENLTPLPAPVRGLTVTNDLAFLAAGAQGVIVLNVSDPDHPRRLARLDTSGEAWAVAVAGTNAFVANGTSGFAALDISDPTNPRIVGTLDTPGNVIAVTIRGRYAYLSDNWIGLRIVDISQPDRLISVGVFNDDKINGVAVSGNYAYLLSNLIGVTVIDISDPSIPRSVNSIPLFNEGFLKGIDVAGNRLYLALDHAGLAVYSISTPISPQWIGQCEVRGFAQAVTVANGFAYVSCADAGVSIVDVRNSAAPRMAGAQMTAGTAFGAAVSGSHAYVADGWAGMQVIDVADAVNPHWTSLYRTGSEPKGILVSGGRAYVADGSAGLRIYTAETNSEPRLLAEFKTAAEAKGVALSGHIAFVAEGLSGMEIMDVAVPTNIVRLAAINSGGEATAVCVLSNYLFLANGPAGLAIYNIEGLAQNPTQAVKVATFATGGSLNGLAIDGNFAYLAAGKSGLLIADIANPAAPRIVGSFDTTGDARSVTLSGNQAFVADGFAGVEIIDVSDRIKPRRAGAYETSGFAMRVGVRDQRAFVASSFGLQTLDISVPVAPQLRSEFKNVAALDLVTSGGTLFVVTQTNALMAIDIDSPLKLAPITAAADFVGLRISGPLGMSVRVQSSTNLADWGDLRTVVLEEGATNLAGLSRNADSPRFYRAFSTAANPAPAGSEIPQVILDSDMGGDGDDIGDLVLLHKLADMGLVNIVGLTYSTYIPYGAPALEAFNIAYGRPNIPVATTKNPWLDVFDCFDKYIADNFPNTIRHRNNAQDSVRFYREILSKAAPRSITIIEASFIMSLYDLMLSGPDDLSPLTGEELLNEKVKLLAISAGDYPSGTEFYFRNMPLTSTYLCNRLKCPILYSGDTLGFFLHTVHKAQIHQLVPTNSIFRAAFDEFARVSGAVYREGWAQPLIWYVAMGTHDGAQKLFDVERGGYNFVDAAGGNAMRSDRVGNHGYMVPVAREADTVAALSSLMYLPPGELPKPYDPHVNLFAQLVRSNGGTVSDTTLQALDEYVKTLKSDGTWERKSIIWPCVGDNLNAALCMLKYPFGATRGILTLVGAAPTSFVESEGLVGNGQFLLDTLCGPFALGLRADSCHLAIYSHKDVPGAETAECGRYEGAESALTLALSYSASYANPFFDSCSVGSGRITAPQAYPTTGYFLGNRTDPGHSYLYRNQALIVSGQTGGGRMPGSSVQIFSYGGINSRRVLSHFSAGPHLTASQLVTEAQALEKLQRALHRSVVR